MAFGDEWRNGARGVLHLTGLTDNSGNTSSLCRLMSSKFPLVVILTEFAAQLRQREMELDLAWVPRNQNEEADALTNERFEHFDEKLRVALKIEELPFLVLDKMFEVADHLYRNVQQKKQDMRVDKVKNKQRGKEKTKRRPLKERDPW